jgi:predicted nucleic acid-binding protein
MFLLDSIEVEERRSGKRQQSTGVYSWAQVQSVQQFFLSPVTAIKLGIGGLWMGRKCEPQGSTLRRQAATVLEQFAGRVLPFGLATARRCTAMYVPNIKSMRDSMISATAIEHVLILVTQNRADFDSTNVRLINPWECPNYWQRDVLRQPGR